MNRQWGKAFRGEGKRPQGLFVDAIVRWRWFDGAGDNNWMRGSAGIMSWSRDCEYQILEPTVDRAEVIRESVVAECLAALDDDEVVHAIDCNKVEKRKTWDSAIKLCRERIAALATTTGGET